MAPLTDITDDKLLALTKAIASNPWGYTATSVELANGVAALIERHRAEVKRLTSAVDDWRNGAIEQANLATEEYCKRVALATALKWAALDVQKVKK